MDASCLSKTLKTDLKVYVLSVDFAWFLKVYLDAEVDLKLDRTEPQGTEEEEFVWARFDIFDASSHVRFFCDFLVLCITYARILNEGIFAYETCTDFIWREIFCLKHCKQCHACVVRLMCIFCTKNPQKNKWDKLILNTDQTIAKCILSKSTIVVIWCFLLWWLLLSSHREYCSQA